MRGRPSAMAFDKTNSDVFYFSSLYYTPKTNPNWVIENHLYKSTNMNDAPEDVIFYDIIENIREIDAEVLDRSPINDIEVYQDHVWVCFGNVQDHKKIYYSSDAGENWQNISYNLGNFPANRILYDTNQDLLFHGFVTCRMLSFRGLLFHASTIY